MNFRNIEDLHEEILKQLEISLKAAMEEGVRLAKEYIKDKFYGTYEPSYYIRVKTNNMLDSIDVDYDIKGDTLIAKLFIKDEKHPKSNSWTDRTFEEIAIWFAEGAYGRSEGYDVIKYTKEQLADLKVALNIIKKTLKKAGFVVK